MPATDWVLTAQRQLPEPLSAEEEGERDVLTAGIMQKLKASIATTKAEDPSRSRVYRFFSSLAPSSEGELFGEEPSRYIFRDTTYAQMKSRWAASDPFSGLTPAEASGMSLSAEWPRSPEPTVIRPATPYEIAKHDAVKRDRKRHDESTRIFEEWGFDLRNGQPLDGVWDENAEQRARLALEETVKRLEQLALLEGSNLEHRPADARSIRSHQMPNTASGLSRVAGMEELKAQLIHEVIGSFREPELFRRYRVSLPNGILFYGPPGCGKTYLARALAEELHWTFQYCRPSDVASPYIHDTVTKIRAMFATAIEKAPSVVFIDEFEGFVPARSALGNHQQYKAEEVNEFLANLECCAEHKVLVIAATNEPEKIDPAVLRSGRFDKLILIPPPDPPARRALLEFHLTDRPLAPSLDTTGIASILEGYSASDIKLLVDEAARMALKQIEPISTGTLLAVLDQVPASISNDDIRRYSAFRSRGV